MSSATTVDSYVSLYRPAGRLGSRSFQILFDLRHDLWMRRGDITLLARVGHKIVELERRIFFQPDGFPLSHTHSLLKAAFVKLPIEEIVRRLRLATRRARHRKTVDSRWDLRAGDVADCRQHVPMCPRMVADTTAWNRPWPARDHRYSYAALVKVALDTTQRARTLEEHRVTASLLVRAVIADEHHQGVAVDPARTQEIGESSNVAI